MYTTANAYVLQLDRQGKIITMNERASELLIDIKNDLSDYKFSKEQMIAEATLMNYAYFKSPIDDQAIMDMFKKRFPAGEKFSYNRYEFDKGHTCIINPEPSILKGEESDGQGQS